MFGILTTLDLITSATWYAVSYYCSNCGKRFNKSYKGGELADDKVECKHCGCNTAKRGW